MVAKRAKDERKGEQMLTEQEINLAQATVAKLKIGDRVLVDGLRHGVVARFQNINPMVTRMDDVTHIYVRFDGLKRSALIHGIRIQPEGE